MINPTPHSLKFRPEINGLRAVAVILVIIFHLNKDWMPFGYIGVDIFFVISGFLITQIISKNLSNGKFKFSDFIVRRIKRILPLLFIVLIISSVVAIVVLSSTEYRYFFRALRYTSAQASNFFFLGNSGYFDLDSKFNALLHTWSLGVEEQFYLVWPLLLLLLHKFKIPRLPFYIIIIALSLSSIFYFKRIESMQYFFMFYARAWEFAIGGFVASQLISPSKSKIVNEGISIISIFCIFIPLFYASSGNQYELYYLLLTVLGVAGIIYSSIHEQTRVAKCLSYKPLLYIGLLSYSLYLWHWPVIVYYNYIVEFSLASAGQLATASIGTIGVIIILATTWVLSILSCKYIEQPCLNAKISNKLTFIVTILSILCFMGLAKLGQEQAKSSWRVQSFSEEVNMDDLEIDIPRSYEKETYPEDILIIGDSHAQHFTPMVEIWAKKHNLKSKTLYKGGTAPLLIYDQFKDYLSYREIIFLDNVKDYILNNPHIKYVFIAAKHSERQGNPLYEKGLSDTIQFLLLHKKKVCLIAQVPELEGTGIRYLEPTHMMNLLFPKKISNENLLALDPKFIKDQLPAMRKIMERLQEHYPTIQLWFPEEYIDRGLQGGIPCYADEGHLNMHGSVYLAPYFHYELDLRD